MPHADGVFLKDNPQKLILEGSVADIPFMIGLYSSRYAAYPDSPCVLLGSCEDEGTLFSLASLNLT